jgi:hypothetical protein
MLEHIINMNAVLTFLLKYNVSLKENFQLLVLILRDFKNTNVRPISALAAKEPFQNNVSMKYK